MAPLTMPNPKEWPLKRSRKKVCRVIMLKSGTKSVSGKAVTDGIKRCLRAFGNALGNCLYDKMFLKKIGRVSAPNTSNKPLDPTQLYRSEDGAAQSAQPINPKPAPTYNNNPVPQPMPVTSVPKYQNQTQNYSKPGPLPVTVTTVQKPIVQSESVSSLDTYAFDEDDSMLMVADLECIDSKLLQSENFTHLYVFVVIMSANNKFLKMVQQQLDNLQCSRAHSKCSQGSNAHAKCYSKKLREE